MKCKVYRGYITIPVDIRKDANINNGDYVDVIFDKQQNRLIIDLNDKNNSIDNKGTEIVSMTKSSNKSNRKIVANFEDASKFYQTRFSECGLVVRTKTKYVEDFCKDCQGQLAKEWEDRVDVHCSYLSSKINKEPVVDDIDEIYEDDEQEEIIEIEEVKIEEPVKDYSVKEDILSIKQQRKKDLELISESIKKANNVIDNKIQKLKPKIEKKKPKISIRHSTSATILQPIKLEENDFIPCRECKQYFKTGFLVDNEFLCRECTTKDFKDYMERGN